MAWHVAAGDEVTLNQVLVEVETEKAVVELPSPFAGTVVELLAGAGETVARRCAAHRHRHARRRRRADADDGRGEGARCSSATARPRRRRAAGGATAAGTSEPASRRPAARPRRPAAGRTAGALHGPAERGRPGRRGRPRPGGIITREDLAAHLAGPDRRPTHAPATARRGRPVRGVQKHMAEAMVAQRGHGAAGLRLPHRRRDAHGASWSSACGENRHFEGLHVTPLAVVARAVVLALRDHPALNSSWDEATAEVVTKHYVNLGIAVAGPRGLVVPNIKDAQDLTLRELTARAGAS